MFLNLENDQSLSGTQHIFQGWPSVFRIILKYILHQADFLKRGFQLRLHIKIKEKRHNLIRVRVQGHLYSFQRFTKRSKRTIGFP